ncbi:L-threonylcarbamoyladenylate synthase [Methylocystis bryophila]|uniref:Threonylcarbamoyl-AMP synthase n=1 Tax=Methylocystis bryophila TaxID=655015 RepID=A0A1W6MXM4_9HYPH|nr:L-threonylcarbamoyladenylate synthase [Methylocystis bryophila]ARN82327.1 threonylcarbamoyl-AMP synthase [Methylocystis bryophila]BDV38478.1 threonylcarbamoyl-AMP synthase [Methylocystis bryophila]
MTALLPASSAAIERAAEILRSGGLVAFPTETVYGLGADAASPHAVAALYAAKGRPRFNPLIAHIATLDAAMREATLPAPAQRLAERFWPGPLTLVAPALETGSVCELARAGLPSVALRVPAHPTALALIEAFGGAIVAPSANRSGHVSPVTAEHVMSDLAGQIDLILDGGRAAAGLESTIVAFLGERATLLRPGATPREAIEEALGQKLAQAGESVLAPGMTASHYAPRARLRLDALTLERGEAGLDFGGALAARGEPVALDLSPSGDLKEAAANLYAHLRALDARGIARAAVAPIPGQGLGEAIRDRLRRAAS